MAPAADWYPDPSGVGELRYWDGESWTPGVVIAGKVLERPMPPRAEAEPAAAHAAAREQADGRVQLPGRAVVYAVIGFVAGLAAGLGLALAANAAGVPHILVFVIELAGLWSGLLGACWLASRRWGTGSLVRDYGLRVSGQSVKHGLLGAAMAYGAAVFATLAVPRHYVGSNTDVFKQVATGPGQYLVFALVATVGAPVVEELFFRGLLLRSLAGALPPAAAIGVSAACFGLAHISPLLGAGNVSVVVSIFAVGIALGIVARKHGVGTSAISHATFNLVSVIAVGVWMLTR